MSNLTILIIVWFSFLNDALFNGFNLKIKKKDQPME